jgi:hypothetical protein
LAMWKGDIEAEVAAIFAMFTDTGWDEQAMEAHRRQLASVRKRTRPKKSRRCPNGHARTVDNTYVWRGKQHCRACRRASKERFKAKHGSAERKPRRA